MRCLCGALEVVTPSKLEKTYDRELVECSLCKKVLIDKPLWVVTVIGQEEPLLMCEDCYKEHVLGEMENLQ